MSTKASAAKPTSIPIPLMPIAFAAQARARRRHASPRAIGDRHPTHFLAGYVLANSSITARRMSRSSTTSRTCGFARVR